MPLPLIWKLTVLLTRLISAYLESIPCLAVKAITDIVGEKTDLGDYRKRLKEIRAKLPEMVLEEVAAL